MNLPADQLHLDHAGADGNGNPIGGLVFSSAFTGDGSMVQMHEWTNFMGRSPQSQHVDTLPFGGADRVV
jgi:hypothetical protein